MVAITNIVKVTRMEDGIIQEVFEENGVRVESYYPSKSSINHEVKPPCNIPSKTHKWHPWVDLALNSRRYMLILSIILNLTLCVSFCWFLNPFFDKNYTPSCLTGSLSCYQTIRYKVRMGPYVNLNLSLFNEDDVDSILWPLFPVLDHLRDVEAHTVGLCLIKAF
ncbi:hypothetical protein [Rhinolophus gammaherpesvirus 1]|uniref:Uncharacterized protein n=1 Tax=Rhinolophus gammaherpesvirus 1 TaxID=2054179 RepID=A0A2Z5U6A5_9GAMA|nr:hypothetical protein [Rhinolophus gammaherpesvirus 1]BBB06476.1 hypothetical protein [Rhinolophus gammaherpesvirus 1]